MVMLFSSMTAFDDSGVPFDHICDGSRSHMMVSHRVAGSGLHCKLESHDIAGMKGIFRANSATKDKSDNGSEMRS